MDAYQENNKNNQGQLYDALPPATKQAFCQSAEVSDHHMTTTLPIELTNATGTYLDRLNEDCLLEIFSQRSLTVMDLLSLAETCKLFKRIAQRVFPKSLRISENRSNLEKILKDFGQYVVALTVCSVSDIMDLVAKYCVAGTLKELEISLIPLIEITDVVAMKLKPILQQLQKLSVRHVAIKCVANVFANLNALIELNIIGQHRCHPIMDNNFPKLQRFTFKEGYDEHRDAGEILFFLERSQTIKCLHLNVYELKSLDVFVRKLGSSCKDLEELGISIRNSCYFGMETTLEFSNYQSLKRLKVHCGAGFRRWIMQLQTSKSLEVLDIEGRFINKKILERVSLLKNLRELRVDFTHFSAVDQWTLTSWPQLTKLTLSSRGHAVVVKNVIGLIKHLINLQELEILEKKFVLSEKEFFEIVKLVEERRNVLTLKCKFEFSQFSSTYEIICDGNVKVKLLKR